MMRTLQPCFARAQICIKPQDGQCMLLQMDEIPISIPPNLKTKGKRL